MWSHHREHTQVCLKTSVLRRCISLLVLHNKVPQTGWLKQQKFIFLTVLEAGSPRLGCRQYWLLLRPPSLFCRRLSSPCVLTSSYMCVCPNLFLWGYQSYASKAQCMTSFYLTHLFKGPMSKCSHILRCWGLGLHHMNFRGTQFSL